MGVETLALQQALHTGIDWTGDTVRTWMQGAMLGGIATAVRLIWSIRDTVRDLQKDVPRLQELIEMHEREIRWLTGKRIAQEAIEQAERDQYQGPEKRHRLRRDHDIVNEALARDYPYPERDDR